MADLERKFRYVQSGCVVYVVSSRSADPPEFAAGVAELLGGSDHLLRVGGEYLRSVDRQHLVEPLLRGDTVVVLTEGPSELGETLAEQWSRATYRPLSTGTGARTAPRIGSGRFGPNLFFELDPQARPGTLAIVQVGDGSLPLRGLRGGVPLIRVEDDVDIRTLEAAGHRTKKSFELIGRSSRAGGTGLETDELFRELCLLHARDERQISGTDDQSLRERTTPLAWRDIQRLLVPGEPRREDELTELHLRGLVDEEKFEFYVAALDQLVENHPSKICSSVWEAVWVHQSREGRGQVFRGQASDKWRLDNTLLRLPPGSDCLDAGTLEHRLRLTDAFLGSLRSRQEELLGTTLDEEELLAVAQHYGFPTPLLDFTRSLRVAAFFATLDAKRRPVDGLIGMIHCFDLGNHGVRGRSEQQVSELGLGNFRLMSEASLRLGSWRLVEPRIPDAENRIARQSGLFLSDYNVRDLRDLVANVILFRQRPGDRFEDPDSGLTEEALLEAATSHLASLAVKTRRRFEHQQAATPLSSTLAGVVLPDPGLIGSSGQALPAVLDEADLFFDAMAKATDGQPDLAAGIADIFTSYFGNARLSADAGTSPEPASEWSEHPGLTLALDRLERLAALPQGQLGTLVKASLPDDDPMYSGPRLRYADPSEGIDERTHIVAACALYLVGWEYLVRVSGYKARGLSFAAREVLAGYRLPSLFEDPQR